jgi:hypothetical protein
MAGTPRNGRVADINQADNPHLLPLFYQRPTNRTVSGFQHQAIQGIHSKNAISDIYFSADNLLALHEGIRYRVYVQSNRRHVIDRQSDNDLKVVMRAIYLQKTTHSSSASPLEQVRRLNGMVLDFCVPRIVNEVDMYLKYKADLGSLPVPIPHGAFESLRGENPLVLREF